MIDTGFLARPWVPAWILLLGSASTFVGLAWDLQWHSDVGPDTFYTLPHLFIYAGAAVSGLVSLAVVLAATGAVRSGRAVDTAVGGRRVAVFGVFQAPAGYLVSGVGAALFLLYGLWDEWWHGLYGFDAVIASPPHVGLLTSAMLAMLGSVMTCAAAAGQPWSGPALVASVAILLGFSMVVLVALPEVGVVDERTVTVAVLSMAALACLASFTRGLRAVLATAGTLLAVQIVLAFFSPWATRLYAASEGLPLRDYTNGLPRMSMLMPATLLLGVAALALAAAATSRRTYAVAGALGGAALAATFPWQAVLLGSVAPMPAEVAATVVAGALLGAGGGLLGERLGGALRLLVASPAREAV
ncbi:hypothetical protein FHX44_115553 [Pseudonocardia hierapolitana]|uniref:Uncharacterized protein n=1 Tax=Pseudonocardia hierapolitana TaxID=1128676 RepID=A0A561SXN0_9PSEU|nr:hypothetical protein [Pseudonocardia hierapolitana]TWF79619.1 hypothetical protein FHX44_115553 [Pseudonocardia hierapolitana]